MAYGANAMIPIEIIEPTFQVDVFNEEVVDANQKAGLDVAEEIWWLAHVHEAAVKLCAKRKYNTRVIPMEFIEGDLVLKRE